MLSFGFETCIKANSPLVNRPIKRHFAGCQTTLQSEGTSVHQHTVLIDFQ